MSDLLTTATQILSTADHEAQSAAEIELTVQEYADLHRLHVQTVYSAIRRGLQIEGRVKRPSPRTIRIIVSRESIPTHTAA